MTFKRLTTENMARAAYHRYEVFGSYRQYLGEVFSFSHVREGQRWLAQSGKGALYGGSTGFLTRGDAATTLLNVMGRLP